MVYSRACRLSSDRTSTVNAAIDTTLTIAAAALLLAAGAAVSEVTPTETSRTAAIAVGTCLVTQAKTTL